MMIPDAVIQDGYIYWLVFSATFEFDAQQGFHHMLLHGRVIGVV